MSVLHSRIIQQAARGTSPATHPYGTGATLMVTPAHAITYAGNTGYYQTLYPSQPATGDVNAVPMAVFTQSSTGQVIPAGRP